MAKGKKANWTIMMYIQADDSLVNFAVQSLRQLKRAASAAGGRLKIAAQFDANNRSNIPRYVFKGKDDPKNPAMEASLDELKLAPSDQATKALLAENFISVDKVKEDIPRDTNMADPDTLFRFIDWAAKECEAEHYGLVTWGHGTELLLDDFVVPGSFKKQRSFLTPIDLGTAFARAKQKNVKFDVIGIDACCMSMIEVAYEIKDFARVLIASQEEVSDLSFPYDVLLTAFNDKIQKRKISDKELRELCADIPRLYAYAYQGYILDRQSSLESISLSSLSLKHVDRVTDLVRKLATALLNLTYDDKTRQLLIEARARSKGFSAGLYVDLYDFCEQLTSRLEAANPAHISDPRFRRLISICDQISETIRSRTATACVIENQAPQNKHCHGLSLYFPYLTDTERAILEAPLAPLVKGGLDAPTKGGLDAPSKGGLDAPSKGGLDAPNKGGLDAPSKGAADTLNQSGTEMLNRVRRQRIGETEAYYGNLSFAKETGWYNFIRRRWTRCLVEDAELRAPQFPGPEVSDLLDERYSAQQCALNLLSECRELGKKLKKKKQHDKQLHKTVENGLAKGLKNGLAKDVKTGGSPPRVHRRPKNRGARWTNGHMKERRSSSSSAG